MSLTGVSHCEVYAEGLDLDCVDPKMAVYPGSAGLDDRNPASDNVWTTSAVLNSLTKISKVCNSKTCANIDDQRFLILSLYSDK